jgi:hypothetical protein
MGEVVGGRTEATSTASPIPRVRSVLLSPRVEQRAAFQPEHALAPTPGTQAELEALVDRYADQLDDARELAKRAARRHPQPSSFQKLGTWAHDLFIDPSDKKRRRR